MGDLESLLGAAPHRFDDWIDEGHFVSRLTVVRSDGIQQTFEARATDHATARQQACALALSATSTSVHPFVAPSMPWSHGPSSALQVMGGGHGAVTPVLLPDAAPPPTVPPSLPLGMTSTAPQHNFGNYPLQQNEQLLHSSPYMQIQQHPQPQPQTQQLPCFQGPADFGGISEVIGQPLFRIDRTPSRADNQASLETVPVPDQECELPGQSTGMTSPTCESDSKAVALVNLQDRGIPGPRPSGAMVRFGKETEQGISSPDLNGISPGDAHVGLEPSSQSAPPLQGNQSRALHARAFVPDVDDRAPAPKRRRANAVSSSADSQPVSGLGTNSLTKNADGTETDDEDDPEDDHLTTYNELCQRGVAKLEVPRYIYTQLSPTLSRPRWECRATAAATQPRSGASVTITKTVIGKSKRDSRRVAAKALLSELVDRKIISQATVATKGYYMTPAPRLPAHSKSTSKIDSKQLAEAAAAVSILNQLWQKERFDGKPKWTLTPTSSGGMSQWICTVFIKTREVGDVSAESTQPQKKCAKQLASYNAVQKLKSLGFPDFETINVQPKPQANVMKSVPQDLDASDKNALQSLKTMDEGTKRRLDSEVCTSGEVATVQGDGGIDSGLGTAFQVPAEVKTLIARNVGDVNEWIAGNLADGASLGLCLDSKSLRETLEKEAKECSVDVKAASFSTQECRAIALSTGKSAILVAASLLEPCVGSDWIPKTLKFMLERYECAKFGFGLDEGAIVLRSSHGIQCANLNNLGSSSHTLKEDWNLKQGKFFTPAGLVSDWLNRKLLPFTDACVESVNGLAQALKCTDHVIAPVLILAVACSLIQGRLQQGIEERRRKGFNRDDYMELSNRLWKPLGIVKSHMKSRRILPN